MPRCCMRAHRLWSLWFGVMVRCEEEVRREKWMKKRSWGDGGCFECHVHSRASVVELQGWLTNWLTGWFVDRLRFSTMDSYLRGRETFWTRLSDNSSFFSSTWSRISYLRIIFQGKYTTKKINFSFNYILFKLQTKIIHIFTFILGKTGKNACITSTSSWQIKCIKTSLINETALMVNQLKDAPGECL